MTQVYEESGHADVLREVLLGISSVTGMELGPSEEG